MIRRFATSLAFGFSLVGLLAVALACNSSTKSGTNNDTNNDTNNNIIDPNNHPVGDCAEVCPNGTICSGITDACEPTNCLPDRLEPNDDREAATLLEGSTSFTGLTVCSGRHDLYSITLQPGEDAIIDATFPLSDVGDIDLLLFKGEAQVQGSRGGEDNEQLRIARVTEETTYILEVTIFPETGAFNTYTLDFQRNPAGDVCTSPSHCDNSLPCLETGFCEVPADCNDPHEPNDAAERAAALETRGPTQGIICSGEDVDFYAFEVENPDDKFYITVEFDNIRGDLDAAVYGPSGIIAGQALSQDDNEHLAILNRGGLSLGTWTLEVYGGTQTINIPYSVTLEVNPALEICTQESECLDGFYCTGRRRCLPLGSCEVAQDCSNPLRPSCDQGTCTCNDNAEPNNTAATATPWTTVEPGALLSTCGEDEDWFSFRVEEGQSIEVEIGFIAQEDDIDAVLYDPAGVEADATVSGAAPELLEATNAAAGTWTLKLFSARPNRGTRYGLNIQLTGP